MNRPQDTLAGAARDPATAGASTEADPVDGLVFRSVRPETLVDAIQDQVREAILDGSLRSGAPIRESWVADQMEVSRAPVREALRRLEQRGLVVKPRNRSYEVTSFTDQDLYELATLRAALETLAAREAMQRDPSALEDRLRDLLQSIASTAESGDARAALAADRRFHEALVDGADSRRLSEVYSTLRDQIELCMRTRHRVMPALDGLAARHAALIEHVRARDGEALARELERHIREGAGLDPVSSTPPGPPTAP